MGCCYVDLLLIISFPWRCWLGMLSKTIFIQPASDAGVGAGGGGMRARSVAVEARRRANSNRMLSSPMRIAHS